MPRLIATGLTRAEAGKLVREARVSVAFRAAEPRSTPRPWHGRAEPSQIQDALFQGDIWTVVRLARQRSLELDDLPPPLETFNSTSNKALAANVRCEARWEELRRLAGSASAPSSAMPALALIRCILAESRVTFICGFCASAMNGFVGTVVKFVVIRAAIGAVENGAPFRTKLSLAFMVAASSALEGLCSVVAFQMLPGQVSHTLIAKTAALLVNKCAKVSGAASGVKGKAKTHGAGAVDISSFFATDVPRIAYAARFMSNLPSGMVGLLGGIGVLLYYLGRGALIGIVGMVLFVTWGLITQQYAYGLEKGVVKFRERRLAALKRVINGHQAVKFHAWEEQFVDVLDERRAEECASLKSYRIAYVSTISAGKGFPPVCAMLTVISVAWLDGWRISAADAFATVAVFQTMRIGVILIPMATGLLGSVLIVYERCSRFLCMPECAAVAEVTEGSGLCVDVKNLMVIRGSHQKNPATPRLGTPIPPAEADETSTGFSLDVPSLQVHCGEVVAVVGSVGSGKSTLVQALLGSIQSVPGPHGTTFKLECTRPVGYSPQESIIISGTVEENILMGRVLDEVAFANACSCASLTRDLQNMPNGRATVVGERGTTLSGGQAHRVCIARAMYGNPDLLCFDGSLAAVDPRVAKNIFDAVRGFVRAKPEARAAIIVLSQLNLLPECDRIIHIETGTIEFNGSYAELLNKNEGRSSVFADFLAGGQGDTVPINVIPTHNSGSGESSISTSKVVDSPIVSLVASGASSIKALELPSKTGGARGKEAAVVQLVTKETVVRGAVPWKVFSEWTKSAHRPTLAASALGYVGSVAVLSCNDIWISHWAAERDPDAGYALVYASLSVGHLVFLVVSSFILVYASINAGEALHGQCFRSVVRAPMSWFEKTPSGRIISRFGNDIEAMDVRWAQLCESALNQLTMFAGILFMLCYAVPILIPVVLFSITALTSTMVLINLVNRDLKRLSNNAVAPVVTNMAEADRSREISRALSCEFFFVERQAQLMNDMLKASFIESAMNNVALLSSQAWCLVIILSTCLVIMCTNIVDPVLAPVALAYAVISPHAGQYCFQMLLLLATCATSLERLFEYLPSGKVPSEAPAETKDDPPPAWPSRGTVSFRAVALRYRASLPLSLNQISFEVKAGHRCGIVGRTGAGKSSCLVALFRLVEIEGGSMHIDGVNISGIGLRRLRRALSIIPQESVLMSGTIRDNLDPFAEHGDGDCARVLSQVGLPAQLMNHQVGGGSGAGGDATLSVGERQLVAIARALLRNCAVVCMDEPTSHIDAATDARMQAAIASAFPASTLIVIAHRLHTVVGFDQVLVLGGGVVLQDGDPAALLATPGPLADMAGALGDDTVVRLKKLAANGAARRVAAASASGLAAEAVLTQGPIQQGPNAVL